MYSGQTMMQTAQSGCGTRQARYSGQLRPCVEYDRQIRYLDYMENGQRGRGAGFVKLERRDDRCNISLQVSGLYRKDHFTRPLLLLADTEERELCKLQLADGGIKIYLESLDSDNLDGQGLKYEQLTGLRIPISEGKEIRCLWSVRPGRSHRDGQRTEPYDAAQARMVQNADTRGENAESATVRDDGMQSGAERDGARNRPAQNVPQWEETTCGGNVQNAPETEETTWGSGMQDEFRREETGSGRSVQDEFRQEEMGSGRSMQDEFRREEVGSGRSMQDEFRREETGSGRSMQDEFRREETGSGRSMQDEFRQEEADWYMSAQGGTEQGTAVQDRKAQTGSLQRTESGNLAIPKSFKEDKWEQLWSIYPHIHPFSDEREYLSFGPSDLIVLPTRYYKLVNNSFLLHGYYNYHHLIFTKVTGKTGARYYIGVPGNLNQTERRTAIMFGFESFECDREPAGEGDYGYYLIPVEL